MPKRGKRSNRESIRRTSKHHGVSQTVKQIVNVKVGGEVRRKKTGRKYRKVQVEPQQIAAPAQMPIVSYQTGYGSFPLIQGTFQQPNQPSAPSNLMPMPSSVMQPSGANAMLEDIGLTRSQIIEVPTKREQLAEMITPVRVPSMEDESAPILFPPKKKRDEQPSLIPRFGELKFPPESELPKMQFGPPKMQFEFPTEISNYTLKGTEPISSEFGMVEKMLQRNPEMETLRIGKTIKVPKERLMQKPLPEEEEISNVQIVATQSMDKFLEAFKQPKLTASALLGLPIEKGSETVVSEETTKASPVSSLTEELYAGKKPKTPTKEQITRNIPPLETYGFGIGKSKSGNIVISDESVVPVVYEKYKPPSEMNKEELIKRYTELYKEAPTKEVEAIPRYMRVFIMDEEERLGIA